MTDTDADVRAFIEALRPVHCRPDGDYKPTDRFRDFRAVFSSDAGKRVLSQIIDYAEGRPVSEADAGDHSRLVWRAARRSVGLWITAIAATPPQPTVVATAPARAGT